MLLHTQIHQIENLFHPLPRQRTGENRFRPIHEIEPVFQLLLHHIHRVGIFFDRVPLVRHHHTGAAVLFDPSRQLLVLLRDPIDHVHHQQHHIRPPNRLKRPVNPKKFRAIVHILFLADPRRIHNPIALSVALHQHIDRIPRRARNRTDDRPVLAHKGIQQTGLAHIRPADDRHINFRLFGPLHKFRQVGH